jgi:hypothetical protein
MESAGVLAFWMVALGAGVAMAAGEGEDPSMLIYGAAQTELATRDVARKLAEMVVKNVYGEAELDAQSPLKVYDGGDRWVIEGSRQPSLSNVDPALLNGRVEVVILKRNCQILKLVQHLSLH